MNYFSYYIHFSLSAYIYNKNTMITRYTEEEFNTAKTSDKLACECEQCHQIFYTKKTFIQRVLSGNIKTAGQVKYCSHKCMGIAMVKIASIKCEQCGSDFHRAPSQIVQRDHQFCSPECYRAYQKVQRTHICLHCGKEFIRFACHDNTFCSRSCASKHNADSEHWNKYSRKVVRSRLEYYIEEQLTQLYPNLQIDYNKKNTINSELDIYIPSLKLGVELNGVLHYEPIYGADKLAYIQNNDDRKFQACLERGIELMIINTGNGNINKAKQSLYFHMITSIIDKKLSA